MDFQNKIAYIRGLVDGLKLDVNKDENKVLLAIIEALDIAAEEIGDMREEQSELAEYIDEIDMSLSEVENDFYDDDCDCGCDCDENDCDDDICECPECGGEIYLCEDTDEDDIVTCPSCNKQFKLAEFCCDDDCSCGCDHE